MYPNVSRILVCAVLACATLGIAGDDSGLTEVPQKSPRETSFVDHIEPMSIFNEEVRCFKFRMDGFVDFEEARAFEVRYQDGKNPPITGAFPDTETNSLCVIAPPDAELAIRTTLAKWFIELQGIPTRSAQSTLEYRGFVQNRNEFLKEMAMVEIAMVGLSEKDDAKSITALKDRLNAFQHEIDVIEQKIAIIQKYQKRMDERNNKLSEL